MAEKSRIQLAVATLSIAPAINEMLTQTMEHVYSSMNVKLHDMDVLSVSSIIRLTADKCYNPTGSHRSPVRRLRARSRDHAPCGCNKSRIASPDLIAFLKLKQGVRHLIGETQQAGEALADGVRESVVAHERQVAVAQATDDVAIALNGLVDKARIEMENINGTASAMKESLLKDISGGWGVFTWSWLEAASIYSVKYLWNGA